MLAFTIVIILPWQTWLGNENHPNQCTLAYNLFTKQRRHGFIFTSTYSFYKVTGSTSNFSTEFREKDTEKNKPFIYREWEGAGPAAHTPATHEKSCWWNHHHPHTALPNWAGFLFKHRGRQTRWLTLEANSPQRQTLLSSRRDLSWPHCHIQTDSQTVSEEGKPSLPEVESHCQKLQEPLLFMVILIKYACLLQKYLRNPLIEPRANYNCILRKRCDFTRTRVTIGDQVPHPFPRELNSKWCLL